MTKSVVTAAAGSPSEARSREEARQIAATFEQLGDGVLVYGADLRVLATSPLVNEIHGLGQNVIAPGMSFREVFTVLRPLVEPREEGPHFPQPDFTAMDDDALRALFRERRGFIETFRGPPRRRFEGRRAVLPGGLYATVFHETSEVITHVDRLAAATSDLRAILDNIGDGVALISPEGRYLALNARFFDLYGLPQGAIGPGASDDEFAAALRAASPLPAAALDRTLRDMVAFATEGAPGTIATAERNLGTGRILSVWRNVLEDGRRVFVMSDITVERELERQRQSLTWIIDNIEDGICLFDADGRLAAYNRRFLDLFDFGATDLRIGMDIADLVRARRALAPLRARRKAPHPDRTGHSVSLRHHASGREIRMTRTLLPGGRVVAAFRDVTEEAERRRLTEEARVAAESASRAKSEFIARMSHELRTPMHGVLGMASLLETTELDARQRQFLDIVIRSGRHMVRLIDDLLMVSTLEAGGVRLGAVPVDMAEIAAGCAGMLRARADAKGIALRCETAGAAGILVRGDPDRLTQILANLAANAVKFTLAGHVRIAITAAPAGDAADIVMEVADTGPGIPPERREEVFEQFHQLDGSIRRSHEGVGLGLAITRSLVTLMGGTIEAGEAPEGGALFTVRLSLPLA